jgi:hypothetical protein
MHLAPSQPLEVISAGYTSVIYILKPAACYGSSRFIVSKSAYIKHVLDHAERHPVQIVVQITGSQPQATPGMHVANNGRFHHQPAPQIASAMIHNRTT